MLFLAEKRRTELIAELTALSMPRRQAEDIANVLDHVGMVDACISQAIRRLGINCQNLTDPSQQHDENNIRKWRAFISADLLLLDAYIGEINDRQLPRTMFPKTAEATVAANVVVDHCKSSFH